jgi:Recombinase
VKFPLRMHVHAEILWVEASYHAIHDVLTKPVYAGAFVYGKTGVETTLDASGARKKRRRHLPREQWPIVIRGHHKGCIDSSTMKPTRHASP